jgi:DNA polymerase III sliding clamp (beta) subunit (PCNA family)
MSDTIKIDAAALAADVAWIAKGKGRPAVPVLGTAQVRITDAGLSLRYTDFDWFREVIVGSGDGFGSDVAVQVSPAVLAGLLKGCKGDAAVTVSDAGVSVGVGSRTLNVPKAAEVEDFPEWPVFEPAGDPAVLESAIVKRGMTSAGTDDTLPMLTHVFFTGGAMVTTDRFRLSVIRYASDGFSAMVPAGALKAFTVGTKGEVVVEHGKLASMANPAPDQMRVRVSAGGRSVVQRVGDHEFPKYQRLIDTAVEDVAVSGEVNKAQLLAAMGNIGKGDDVQLEWRNDGTMLVQMRGRFGDVLSEDTVSVRALAGEGWPLVARYNAPYLASLLKGIAAEAITISARDAARPMSVKGSDSDSHLLMPIRIAA